MQKPSTLVAALLFATAGLTATAQADEYYEVTITNLTHAQAFTPILVASHREGPSLFQLGAPASPELAALAEGGDTGPMTAMLEDNPWVQDVANSGGLLMPGESVTVLVSAAYGAHYLSLASMLIPTNDSFIALNGIRAPKDSHHGKMFYSPAYDAGSEPNDELCSNIPGPVCGGEGGSPDEGGEGHVHISRGIAGIGDLARETYDWKNPTASIEIRRIGDDEDYDD